MELNPFDNDQLYNYIKKNSKKANRRLKSLASRGYERSRAYSYVNEQSYKYDFIKRKENIPMFSVNKKMTRNQMLQEAVKIQNFLNAKTSTIRGIKKTFQKSVDTINEKNPELHLTTQKAIDIFTSETFKKSKESGVGSDIVLQLLSQNYNDKSKIESVIDDYLRNGGETEYGLLQTVKTQGLKANV